MTTPPQNPVAAQDSIEEFLLYCSTGKLAMMRMEIKADPGIVNRKGKEGMPPLHAAIHWGEEEAMHLLLKNGADPRQKDKDGRTAAVLADILSFTQLSQPLRAAEQQMESKEKAAKARAEFAEVARAFKHGLGYDLPANVSRATFKKKPRSGGLIP